MSREIFERIGQLSQSLSELQSQVETALEKSEASRRYVDFVRSSTDWTWETDAHLSYTYASEGFATVFGSPARAMEGQYLFSLTHFRRIDDDLFALVDKIQEHHPFRNVEMDLIDRAGGTHRIMLSGVPAFDDETGRFIGYRGAGIDITGRPAQSVPNDDERDAALYRQAVEAARLGSLGLERKNRRIGHQPGPRRGTRIRRR